MGPFKRILVATDFEPASRHAADIACGIAAASRGEVTVLHAWDVPLPAYAAQARLPVDDVRAAARAAIETERARLAGRGAVIHALLAAGRPTTSIADAVMQHGFDLVVLGTHGRHGVSRVMLGSVAEWAVRTLSVPVLTVHAPADANGHAAAVA